MYFWDRGRKRFSTFQTALQVNDVDSIWCGMTQMMRRQYTIIFASCLIYVKFPAISEILMSIFNIEYVLKPFLCGPHVLEINDGYLHEITIISEVGLSNVIIAVGCWRAIIVLALISIPSDPPQYHLMKMTGMTLCGSWITTTWRTCMACSKKLMVRVL